MRRGSKQISLSALIILRPPRCGCNWGLRPYVFAWKQPAHKKIGVVDAQWIVHQGVPSLGNQVNPSF